MAEYIEREALLKAAEKDKAIGLCEADIADVRHLINGQPTADVVEVVRCEACLHRSQYADENGLYKCGAIQCEDGHCIKVSPGFSCVAGKRRTDGDKHG